VGGGATAAVGALRGVDRTEKRESVVVGSSSEAVVGRKLVGGSRPHHIGGLTLPFTVDQQQLNRPL